MCDTSDLTSPIRVNLLEHRERGKTKVPSSFGSTGWHMPTMFLNKNVCSLVAGNVDLLIGTKNIKICL